MLRWATASHRGRIRPNNEDSVTPTASGHGEGPLVVAVADGMGGHAAGDVASRLAIEGALSIDGSPAERVEAANQAVLDGVGSDPARSGMGTTMTLVEIDGNRATVAHVGDSRAYLIRDRSIRQITDDHTVVNEYVKAGTLTAEEAAVHPQRSMLTRALGLMTRPEIDVIDLDLEPGDRILLCSDGLTSMIDDDSIAGVLNTETDPEAATWRLIDEANAAGGNDNITVALVDVIS